MTYIYIYMHIQYIYIYSCMHAYGYMCVKAMLTDCKSTNDFCNDKRRVKFTYDFHRLLRGSYRAFPCSYFTFHIITSTVKKKRNGERASLIKSTIFVTSSVAGHAQTDFGVFPFTAETRVAM